MAHFYVSIHIQFLNTENIKIDLQKYIDKYDELLNNATYLKKGFNHYNATTIHKNLKDNGYFKAEHTINLNNKGEKKEITSDKELLNIINEEKNRILNDKELKATFEAIDKKISNARLRNFREFLFEHKEILPELANLSAFKQKLWISYLKIHKELFTDLITEYKNAQKEIETIIKEAKKQKTDWENVIDIFKERFFVPFSVDVKNKEDTILKNEAPSLHFIFEDKKEVDKKLLFEVLSRGEQRAFYLLNIIFEIESRKKQKNETLFIIDDIADSFDYKNKYAIIEYLKDISEDSLFKQIILTHNYDFHRSISSRLDMDRNHKLNASKSKEKIILEIEKYQNNPFDHWKKHLNNDSMLIASIPFVRNLADYCGCKDEMDKLTELLHMKNKTTTMCKKDIKTIFEKILVDCNNQNFDDEDEKVIDLIFSTAKILSQENKEVVDLENKIVLSIAIRLKAEMFMIAKIDDQEKIKTIQRNQTFELIKMFKNKFPDETNNIKLLEQVNLMTPENIHLNSFMYEPILDMSIYHLRELFKQVEELTKDEFISQYWESLNSH